MKTTEQTTRMLEVLRQGTDTFLTTKVDALLNWARKYSMFAYPFVTACCGMEYMSVAGPRYDVDRFGCALPRFSPRQADLLWVVGTITHRQAPILKKVYDQMAEPKWVMAFGACTCSGESLTFGCSRVVTSMWQCQRSLACAAQSRMPRHSSTPASRR